MDGGPNTRRREIDPAWIGPGVGNEFWDRFGRNTWIDFHHIGRAHDAGDGRNVADEIEIELVVNRCADRVIRPDQEERVAVRSCAHDRLGAILPPAPGRLSTTNGCPFRSDSHWPVRRARVSDCAAGGKRDNHGLAASDRPALARCVPGADITAMIKG